MSRYPSHPSLSRIDSKIDNKIDNKIDSHFMDKSTHILYMYILVKAGIVRGLLGAELYFMLCTQSQYSTVYSIQCEYTVKKTNYSRFKLEDFRCVLQQLKQTHLFPRNSQ